MALRLSLPVLFVLALVAAGPVGVAATATGGIAAAKSAGSQTTVLVSKLGFEQDTSDTGTFIDYGLVLTNRTTREALNLTVQVTALDKLGRSVAHDVQYVTLVPATTRFNLGGTLASEVSLAVTRLRVKVSVGATRSKDQSLPRVAHVAITQDGRVTGTITNPYSKPLPSTAMIFAVFLNPSGRVVGGGFDMPGADVLPGRTVSFSMYPESVPTSATSAIVSVDPCGPLTLDGCPIVGRI